MRHYAPKPFWECYERLPVAIQRLADKNFTLLKQDSTHPSLQFKKVGRFRSVRVGMHYRALAVEEGEDLVWIWIGSHADYDRLIGLS